MPSSLSRYSLADWHPKKLFFQILWCIFEIIQFIHIYPLFQAHGPSLRHILDKVTWWHFQSTSKEVIWSNLLWSQRTVRVISSNLGYWGQESKKEWCHSYQTFFCWFLWSVEQVIQRPLKCQSQGWSYVRFVYIISIGFKSDYSMLSIKRPVLLNDLVWIFPKSRY